jgi:hypothetical protein
MAQRLAICADCKAVYAFTAITTIAETQALCIRCGGKAVVGEATENGALIAYQQAFPFSNTTVDRRRILKLIGNLVSGHVSEKEALESAQLDPQTHAIIVGYMQAGFGLIGILIALYMAWVATEANEISRAALDANARNDPDRKSVV